MSYIMAIMSTCWCNICSE